MENDSIVVEIPFFDKDLCLLQSVGDFTFLQFVYYVTVVAFTASVCASLGLI